MKNKSKKHFSFVITHFSFALATAVALSLLNPAVANAYFDESQPYNSEDVAEAYLNNNENMDLNAYIEESTHWTLGDEFERDGKTRTAVTLDDQYKYNRYTGEIGKITDDSKNGDIVFAPGGENNTKGYDNTPYMGNAIRNGDIGDYVATGKHIYSHTPKDGTLIPIEKWVNFGQFFADHHENLEIFDNGEAAMIPNEGRFAIWRGITFHSSRTDIPMQLTYEKTSPCRNENWSGESMTDYWNYNSTGFVPVAACCGEYLYWMYTYAPIEALKEIPVFEQNKDIILCCAWCLGLENQVVVNHQCRALSSNLLKVAYDKNADDASNYMYDSRFLYHGGNEYEGKEIVVDSYVKDNEFSRTGYTFKGWATSPSGPVKYAPGTPLSMLKSEYATPTNGATITLYAVWEAKKGGVNIIHSNIAKGGAAYKDNANGTTQTDGSWISNEISYPNGITLNGTVTLPTGYTATFDAYTNGGTVEGNSLKEITAEALEDTVNKYLNEEQERD